MSHEPFESMLTGGHPNSLGRTVEVVDIVLADQARLQELYHCYQSADEVVRLRTSSAIKRLTREKPEWLVPYIDPLLTEIAGLDQASAQWTLAQLFELLRPHMTPTQMVQAVAVMQRNLDENNDWIVLNTTMQVLFDWSSGNDDLRAWLHPRLLRLRDDPRKSVAKRAHKLLAKLDN